MKKNDFFFGATAHINLFDVNELANSVSNDFFTAQINRYLSENNGKMEIRCDASCPPFLEFINKINPNSIGNIKIYARTDLNSAVKATLACEILLEQGVIIFAPQWCAYKESRSDEIITTLLAPIHSNNLEQKTFIKWDEDTLEPLYCDNDYEEEIMNIFSLSKYPTFKRNEKYIEIIKNADSVGIK